MSNPADKYHSPPDFSSSIDREEGKQQQEILRQSLFVIQVLAKITAKSIDGQDDKLLVDLYEQGYDQPSTQTDVEAFFIHPDDFDLLVDDEINVVFNDEFIATVVHGGTSIAVNEPFVGKILSGDPIAGYEWEESELNHTTLILQTKAGGRTSAALVLKVFEINRECLKVGDFVEIFYSKDSLGDTCFLCSLPRERWGKATSDWVSGNTVTVSQCLSDGTAIAGAPNITAYIHTPIGTAIVCSPQIFTDDLLAYRPIPGTNLGILINPPLLPMPTVDCQVLTMIGGVVVWNALLAGNF